MAMDNDPDGRRARVVPRHRAYAAAMTEDASLTGEQAERLTGALREMDGRSGYTVQYGPGALPHFCGAGPVDAHCTDEPETVAGCDDCLDLVAEDLADNSQLMTTRGGASTAGSRLWRRRWNWFLGGVRFPGRPPSPYDRRPAVQLPDESVHSGVEGKIQPSSTIRLAPVWKRPS